MYICVFRIKDEGENIENASVRFRFWVTMWCNKLHGEKTNFLCTAFRHAMLGIFVTIFFKSIIKSYNRRYLKTVLENVPLILPVNWPRMSFKKFPWIFLICSMKSIVFKGKKHIKVNGSFTVECIWYYSLENCSRRPPFFSISVYKTFAYSAKTSSHDFSLFMVRIFDYCWQYIVTVVILYVIITSLLINVVEAFTYFKCIIHSLINKASSHDFSFIVGIFDYCWQYIVTVVILYVIITSLLINVVEAFTYFKCIIHSLINKASSHDFSFIVRLLGYCWQYSA